MKNSRLTHRELTMLTAEFAKIPSIEQVILFGSRALGTAEAGSDIDLCVMGKAVDRHAVLTLKMSLEEETQLPYFFDIIDYRSIENDDLKRHVDTHGKEIYRRAAVDRLQPR